MIIILFIAEEIGTERLSDLVKIAQLEKGS